MASETEHIIAQMQQLESLRATTRRRRAVTWAVFAAASLHLAWKLYLDAIGEHVVEPFRSTIHL